MSSERFTKSTISIHALREEGDWSGRHRVQALH